MKSIDIEAKSFWEFRKLLKLCYQMGYYFGSGNKYSAFELWFGFRTPYSAKGLSLYENYKMKYIEDDLDIDTISYKEYLNVIHANI